MRLPTDHSEKGRSILFVRPLISQITLRPMISPCGTYRGQHTLEILQAAGLSEIELKSLKDEGVI